MDAPEKTKLLIMGASLLLGAGALGYHFYQNRRATTTPRAKSISNVNTWRQEFDLSTEQLKVIVDKMKDEMTKGLEGSPSSLKMLFSFVGRPSGQEKGTFFALDLGGTNFRVIKLELLGGGLIGNNVKEQFTISKDAMTGTAENLFDFIAECVQKFVDKHEPNAQGSLVLGFTFSFPVNQTAINEGTLIKWTKGFTTSGVEGKDVVKLLAEAFGRKNMNVKIVALINDTVGTMVARGYEDSKTTVGLILGTGTNACYAEKLSNIKKFNGKIPGDEMIINMEWGAFGDGSNILPLTRIDKQLDAASVNPGNQLFEKLMSGMYLGEIARQILVDLMGKGDLFVGQSPEVLNHRYGLETSVMAAIENDKSPDLSATEQVIKEKLKVSSTLAERELIKEVCSMVARRAARLSAAGIYAVASKINKLDCTVAVDGSVYEHYPGFKSIIQRTLKELDPSTSITLQLTRDGSGIGASIIAAIAASNS